MTFKMLTGDANKSLHHSNVRPGDDTSSDNLKADLLTAPNIVKSLHDSDGASTLDTPLLIDEENEPFPQLTPRKQMPLFDPLELVERSFLKDVEDA